MRLEVEGADLPVLCDRVRVELRDGHPDVLVFEVGGLVSPDLWTVDALARARLIARRDGCELLLAEASVELLELLALAGLSDVVPCEGSSGPDGERHPELGEEARGVQEERDPADPAA